MHVYSRAGNFQQCWRSALLHNVSILTAMILVLLLGVLPGCSKTGSDGLQADKSKFSVADEAAPSVKSVPAGGQAPNSNKGVTNSDLQAPAVEAPSTDQRTPVGSETANTSVPLDKPFSATSGFGAGQADSHDRTYTVFAAHTSDEPAELLKYFSKADEAIRDLTIAAQNRQVDKEQFMEVAKRICLLKHAAAEALFRNTKSTPDQQKAGRLCQLESLSNLAGLKDVEAAKKLQALAMELEKGADPDLAHQSKLVMIGFRISALEDGLEKDPASLLTAVDELLVRPQDQGYPELMAIQNCAQRLAGMGFKEAATALIKKLADTYRTSPDPELSMMAWTLEVTSSSSFQTFTQALQKLLAMQAKDGSEFIQACTELCDKFPSINTLVQLANHLVNIEYSGNVETSKQLAALIREKLPPFSASPLAAELEKHIQTQEGRLNALGKPLDLADLVSVTTGQPLDWAQYRGKVVLVDFWASWCVPCLNEIPNILEAHKTLADRGFEVLGINVDHQNLAEVDNFIRGKNFPWQTVRSNNPNALGFETPIVKKLGISAIPFVILVDKEGKIAAMHVRGEKIIPTVQAMLEIPAG